MPAATAPSGTSGAAARSTIFTRPDGRPLGIHVPTACAAAQRARLLALIRRNGGSEAHRIQTAQVLLFDLDSPVHSKQLMRSTAGMQPPVAVVTAQWLEDSVAKGEMQDLESSRYDPGTQLKALEAQQAREASEDRRAARQEALQERSQQEEEESPPPPLPPVQKQAPAAVMKHVPSKSRVAYDSVDREQIVAHLAARKEPWSVLQISKELAAETQRHSQASYQTHLSQNMHGGQQYANRARQLRAEAAEALKAATAGSSGSKGPLRVPGLARAEAVASARPPPTKEKAKEKTPPRAEPRASGSAEGAPPPAEQPARAASSQSVAPAAPAAAPAAAAPKDASKAQAVAPASESSAARVSLRGPANAIEDDEFEPLSEAEESAPARGNAAEALASAAAPEIASAPAARAGASAASVNAAPAEPAAPAAAPAAPVARPFVPFSVDERSALAAQLADLYENALEDQAASGSNDGAESGDEGEPALVPPAALWADLAAAYPAHTAEEWRAHYLKNEPRYVSAARDLLDMRGETQTQTQYTQARSQGSSDGMDEHDEPPAPALAVKKEALQSSPVRPDAQDSAAAPQPGSQAPSEAARSAADEQGDADEQGEAEPMEEDEEGEQSQQVEQSQRVQQEDEESASEAAADEASAADSSSSSGVDENAHPAKGNATSPAFTNADISQRSLHHDAKRRSVPPGLQRDRQEAASQTKSPTPVAVPRFDGALEVQAAEVAKQAVLQQQQQQQQQQQPPVAQPLPPPAVPAAPRQQQQPQPAPSVAQPPPPPAVPSTPQQAPLPQSVAKRYVSVAVGSSQVVPIEAVSPQLKRRRSDEAAPAAPPLRTQKRARHTIADAGAGPQAGRPLVPRHSSARYYDFSRDDEEGDLRSAARQPTREAQAAQAGPSRHTDAEQRKMRDVAQWRDRSSGELGVVDHAAASPPRRAAAATAAPPQPRERERSHVSSVHSKTHEERLARAKAKFTRDVCAFRDEFGFSVVSQALPYLRSGDVARARQLIEADIARWGREYDLSRGDVISSIREAQGDLAEARRLMRL